MGSSHKFEIRNSIAFVCRTKPLRKLPERGQVISQMNAGDVVDDIE